MYFWLDAYQILSSTYGRFAITKPPHGLFFFGLGAVEVLLATVYNILAICNCQHDLLTLEY